MKLLRHEGLAAWSVLTQPRIDLLKIAPQLFHRWRVRVDSRITNQIEQLTKPPLFRKLTTQFPEAVTHGWKQPEKWLPNWQKRRKIRMSWPVREVVTNRLGASTPQPFLIHWQDSSRKPLRKQVNRQAFIVR